MNLRFLLLQSNTLNGTIPEELASLVNLEVLDLENLQVVRDQCDCKSFIEL